MGCPCEIRLAGSKDPTTEGEHCLGEIRRFEAKYSRYSEDSLVSEINRNAGLSPTPIDDETDSILDYADVCFQLSDGRFDITSGVLRRLWQPDMSALPAPDDIAEVTRLIGWQKVRRKPGEILLPEAGMQIDLGGVVKEYVADAVVQLALKLGVTSGIVNLGGDIAVIGPQPSGEAWDVGVADPDDSTRAIATIKMKQGAITTSGGYERFIEIGDRKYSHLLDPTTGWPADNLLGVSVIADQAVVAGSLSTIALLMPEDEALSFLADSGAPYLAIDTAHHIYRSEVTL
ncbi:MAG: FAD:protein FMN transferase [Pseudomonadales bacterium]|jgi:thiamine biosynthesis lipoprotein|nr:FAD:protein FMN transferase [Pseudomonadales bacterium]